LGRLYEAEEFEELRLVLFFDAHACVLDLHLEVALLRFLVEGVGHRDGVSLLGELDGVRLNVEEHLLQAAEVGANLHGRWFAGLEL